MKTVEPMEVIMLITPLRKVRDDGEVHSVRCSETFVQTLVRCKECKHHTDVEPYDTECELILSNAVFCQHFAVVRDKDWFCADGERRTE